MTTVARRTFAASLALVVMLVVALAATGCCEQTVRVETGTRTMCTYGEVVSSDVSVVEVPASQAGKYRIVTKTVLCPAHERAQAVYAEAQDALRRGDLAAARASLAEVIRLDPKFRNAAKQASELDAGKTPTSDDASGTPPAGGSTTPTGTTPPDGPVASLVGYVPDAIVGYTAQAISADAFRLTREYVPTTAPVRSLVVVAEQFGDAAAATAALAKGPKRDYSAGGTTITVNGRPVFFGTDGNRFAAVAWTDGAVMIIAEASVKSGAATSLKTPLTDVANTIIP